MSEETKQPETTGTQDGAAATETGTAQDGGGVKKKRVEFDAETQALFNSKIDEVYGRAWGKAEKTFAGQLADANSKIEALTTELTAFKEGKAKPEQTKGEEVKPTEVKSTEPNKDMERLMAQIAELQDGLKTIKGERDTLQATLQTEKQQRQAATMKDRFISAVPQGISFFDVNEVYSLIKEQGQLQMDEHGALTVINPATGNPRLGKDMEPMQPADYIAEFAGKRPWLVRADGKGGTGAEESRRVSPKTSGEKSVREMSREEFEAHILAIKNQAR